MAEAATGAARLRASVARGGSIGVLGAVSSTVGGFFLVVVAARALGPVSSGQLFAAIAVFTVLINAAKLGADTALVRFVSQRIARGEDWAVPALLRIAVPPTLVVSCLLALALLLAAGRVADLVYTGSPSHAGIGLVRELAVFIPAATVTLVLLGATRGFGSVTAFVGVEQMFKPLSRPVLVGVAVLAGGGTKLALGAWLAPVVVGLLVAIVALRRQLQPIPPAVSDRGDVSPREFWRFAGPRALSGFLEIVAPWTAVLLLSGLSGSADAAIFTALSRVAIAGTMVMVAMRLALGPHLSAAFAVRDGTTVSLLHEHSTVLTILVSWPFFILVAVFAHPVLAIFGGDFSAGSTALIAVAVGNLVNVAVGNVQSVILMGGRSSWNLIDTASAVLTQVVLGLWLIPQYGVTGAGIAYTAGIIVNNVTAALQVRFGLRTAVWSHAISAACLLTAVTFVPLSVVCRWLIGDSLLALVVALLAGSTLCIGCIRWRPRLLRLDEGLHILGGRISTAATRARGER